MPYTLIKGDFIIHYPENPRSGPEPDGDTLKFRPDNRMLIESLPRGGRSPRFTQNGITTLRFEGIDALETHYLIEGEAYHQHSDLASAGRNALLEVAGFGEVVFFPDSYKVSQVENHPVRGYILSNGLDVFGRTICFCFNGDHPMTDGSVLHLEPRDLENSMNVHMLASGQAYPAFYLGLPAELRSYLRDRVIHARHQSLGFWPLATVTVDESSAISGAQQLRELVIWPKLFRRLTAYFHDGHFSLSRFHHWLREDMVNRDDRVLLPNLELGNMHDLVEIDSNRIRMTYSPEDIVIVPDDYVVPVRPPQREETHIGSGDLRIIAALVNPKGQERGHEFVIILNTTDHEADLREFKLSDNAGTITLGDGVLGPAEILRIPASGNVRLSNERDTLTLTGPDNLLIHQVSYTSRELPEEGYAHVFC